jgi:hypothetical protein
MVNACDQNFNSLPPTFPLLHQLPFNTLFWLPSYSFTSSHPVLFKVLNHSCLTNVLFLLAIPYLAVPYVATFKQLFLYFLPKMSHTITKQVQELKA